MNAVRLPGGRRFFLLRFASLCGAAAALWLTACAAAPEHEVNERDAVAQILSLLPADAILLGEQHDAPAHHRIEAGAVAALAARGELAALALEMADQGRSTRALATGASEAQVKQALGWNEAGWPWHDYAGAVMAAVRAGVPVVGANLPREQMKDAMANAALDDRLTAAVLFEQQQAIREGHCDLLPESQIAPMTRIQIARDQAMARTVEAASVPGRTVLLIAGVGHVRRDLGIPLHFSPKIKKKVVIALVQRSSDAANKIATEASLPAGTADLSIRTAAPPPKDHCAELRSAMQRR